MQKPKKPLQIRTRSITRSVSLYDGGTLQSLIDQIGTFIDFDTVTFAVHCGYYDEMKYSFNYSYEEEYKVSDEQYAKDILKYEKKLLEYQNSLKITNK